MTSRAVIILTEPERCKLAGIDVLREAVLQVQQLNKAGLPTSQTFCDHPPSAMKFIEAYAKAYPELQLGAADLPLPEQLYSVVAEGRIIPLEASTALPAAKLWEASQPYPLYVLSLGAPDALMRALKQTNFPTRDIKIIQIAPVEDSTADPSGVAKATAHDGRFCRAEASADREANENNELALANEGRSDPLQLDSVEDNLDRIHVNHTYQHDNQHHRAWDELASSIIVPDAAVLVAAGAPGEVANTGVGAPGPSSGANHEGNAAGNPAAVGTAGSGASHESDLPLPSAAGISSPVGEPSNVPDTDATAPGADGGSTAYGGVMGDTWGYGPYGGAGDPAVSETDLDAVDSDGKHDEEGTAADRGKLYAQADTEAGQESALPESSDPEPETRSDMRSRSEGSSLGDPGCDVIYPPNASFGTKEDVSYPLPAETGFDGLLRDVFGHLAGDETVDLEVMISSLADPPGSSSVPLEELPFGFRGLRGANSPGADHAEPSNSAPEAQLSPADSQGSDHDDAGNERAPVTHDLDI